MIDVAENNRKNLYFPILLHLGRYYILNAENMELKGYDINSIPDNVKDHICPGYNFSTDKYSESFCGKTSDSCSKLLVYYDTEHELFGIIKHSVKGNSVSISLNWMKYECKDSIVRSSGIRNNLCRNMYIIDSSSPVSISNNSRCDLYDTTNWKNNNKLDIHDFLQWHNSKKQETGSGDVSEADSGVISGNIGVVDTVGNLDTAEAIEVNELTSGNDACIAEIAEDTESENASNPVSSEENTHDILDRYKIMLELLQVSDYVSIPVSIYRQLKVLVLNIFESISIDNYTAIVKIVLDSESNKYIQAIAEVGDELARINVISECGNTDTAVDTAKYRLNYMQWRKSRMTFIHR